MTSSSIVGSPGGVGVDGGVEAVAQFLGGTAGAGAGAGQVDARVRGLHGLVAPHEDGVAVAGDLLADLLAFGDGGGLGHGVEPGAADALLDAVLGQQLAERVAQQPRVLAVHHGASSSRAA